MIRSALGKVAWVGRTASMVFGLALVMALIFGAVSVGLAANGNPFILGKAKNTATKVTGLIGKVASGPALKVTNPSGGSALGLQVNAGQAPLTVNADAGKATNLDADKLDGQNSDTYLPGDLPAGKTVRGNFYLVDPATSGGQYFGEGISFGYRLPSLPITHYIKSGDPVPAGCSGNSTTPEAAPGHLCIFEASAFNVTPSRGVERVSRQGSGIYMQSNVGGHTFMVGTWAVTAPTDGTAAAASSRSTVAKDGPTE